MSSTKQNDYVLNIIREHSYFLPEKEKLSSSEVAQEEREVQKKIIQRQLENNNENIYPTIDLYTAYHALRRNKPETNFIKFPIDYGVVN